MRAFTTDPLARARGARDSAAERLRAFEASAVELTAMAEPEDLSEALTLRERRTHAKALAELARERLDAAEAALKVEEAAAAEREALAEEEAADRESAALAKRLRAEYVKHAVPLAELFEAIRQNQQRMATINARRRAADRPHIPDAEWRVRRSEARTIPASTRVERMWLDPETGERPTMLVTDPRSGQLVPADGHSRFKLTDVTVTQSPEHVVPAQMPTSLAAVHLPGFVAGEPAIWPRPGSRR